MVPISRHRIADRRHPSPELAHPHLACLLHADGSARLSRDQRSRRIRFRLRVPAVSQEPAPQLSRDFRWAPHEVPKVRRING